MTQPKNYPALFTNFLALPVQEVAISFNEHRSGYTPIFDEMRHWVERQDEMGRKAKAMQRLSECTKADTLIQASVSATTVRPRLSYAASTVEDLLEDILLDYPELAVATLPDGGELDLFKKLQSAVKVCFTLEVVKRLDLSAVFDEHIKRWIWSDSNTQEEYDTMKEQVKDIIQTGVHARCWAYTHTAVGHVDPSATTAMQAMQEALQCCD